jgi:hypothetical protein
MIKPKKLKKIIEKTELWKKNWLEYLKNRPVGSVLV